MDYRIINGTIIDGTGAPARINEVLLRDGKIARAVHEDAHIIDARGLIVAPGFIDTHRHADFAALVDPRFGEAELAQGITSAIVGNCGLAPVPNAPDTKKAQFDYIAPCLGMASDFPISSHDDYANALRTAALPVNIGFLCATGAVLACLNGYEHTPLSPGQSDQALRLIDEAFDAGALGLSSGLMYRPECYAPRDLFVRMAERAARRNAVWTCHIRVEGDALVEAVDEVISIAKDAGVRLNISHFKATGVRNFRSTIFRAIDRIEWARAEGLPITVDFYPYTYGATTLSSLLPPGIDLSSLDAPDSLTALLRVVDDQPPGWDDMAESIGWERVIVSSVQSTDNRRYEGMSLAAIAREWDLSGWGTVLRLLLREEGKVGIILQSMCEDDVRAVASLPYAALISDALYGPGDKPHPRRFGAFPRLLREYAIDSNFLSLEQAIHKMTAMPADRYGLCGRGRIAEGFAADLALFDPAQIRDRADYAHPTELAEGMRYVFIGGELSWANGRITKPRGELIQSTKV